MINNTWHSKWPESLQPISFNNHLLQGMLLVFELARSFTHSNYWSVIPEKIFVHLRFWVISVENYQVKWSCINNHISRIFCVQECQRVYQCVCHKNTITIRPCLVPSKYTWLLYTECSLLSRIELPISPLQACATIWVPALPWFEKLTWNFHYALCDQIGGS